MIQVRGLSCEAPDGRRLLEDLDLEVPAGGNLLVSGASGSGKSQVLRVLAGAEGPRCGEVRISGVRVWPGEGALALAGRVRMGFAFATGGLLSNLTLADNIALPLRFLGLSAAEAIRRRDEAMTRLGLGPVAALRPHAVSGAARRHANLARVLALDPEVILLDEPLEGLDAQDRAVAQELVAGWAADSRRTLVLALEAPALLPGLTAQRLELRSHPSPLEMP